MACNLFMFEPVKLSYLYKQDKGENEIEHLVKIEVKRVGEEATVCITKDKGKNLPIG